MKIVIGVGLLFDDREDVFLVHDEDRLAGRLLLELVAGPRREDDAVTLAHLQRPASAVLEHLARPHGENGPSLRLFLRVVRPVNAATRLFSRLGPADDDAISKRFELHRGLCAFWDGASNPSRSKEY